MKRIIPKTAILKTPALALALSFCLAAIVTFCFTPPLALAQSRDEQQLLDILKSGAPPQEKDAACAELKRIGTARSVPALAELLTDAQLSHSARYALESMPAPEAGLALIEALDKATGLTLVGIIHSLGRRREAAAVPKISGFLAASDSNVASAAAVALGRIGRAQAVNTLFAALSDIRRTQPRKEILDALLGAANQALAEGGRDKAYAFFEKLYRIPTPDQIRAAAYRGLLVAADRSRALELIKTAVLGDDIPIRPTALEMAREIEGPEVAQVLCGILDKVEPPIQVALIEALGQRGDTDAAPALIVMAKSPDSEVCVAALGALGDLGDDKAVSILMESAGSTDEVQKRAARQALLVLRHGNVTNVLISRLTTGQPAAQAEAGRALAGRGDREAVADLMAVAKKGSDSARKAAFLTLGQLADTPHITPLVRLVVEAGDETARTQARDALRTTCQRLHGWGVRVDAEPIVAGLAGDDSSARAALLQAASALSDSRLRTALRSALSDKDKSLREAAILALYETRDPKLLPELLILANQASDLGHHIQAVRGYIRLATDRDSVELTDAQRVDALRQILPATTRPEEKWLLLSGLAKTPDLQALEIVLMMLEDAATRAEAAQAVIEIAAGLKETQADAARNALIKVLATAVEPEQRQAAEKALDEINTLAGLPPTPAFSRLKLDGAFRSEGVAVADFNRDGRLDIATGNILYSGPDWRPRPMLSSPKEYNPEGYSEEFLCFAEELDGDGWADLIVVGFPGAKTRWLRNPGRSGEPWREYTAVEKTSNESPDWIDADKDGNKELLFVSEEGTAFARPSTDPTKPWPIRVIAGPKDPRPGHGLGVGDINGDGRDDVVCPEGFWEAPADPASVPWVFHKAKIGFEAPAQMVVLDVDGDGDSDVVSSGAHRYGLWWYEQTKEGWTPHEIDHTISQLHALHLADLNRDGLPDLVTGKRFWAHREGDDGIDDPAIVCWFELRREGGKPSWVRHDIDSDSGVGLHFQLVDLDDDGLLDIVSSNKKGVYLFRQLKKS
jgi:HEAT repeat protein